MLEYEKNQELNFEGAGPNLMAVTRNLLAMARVLRLWPVFQGGVLHFSCGGYVKVCFLKNVEFLQILVFDQLINTIPSTCFTNRRSLYFIPSLRLCTGCPESQRHLWDDKLAKKLLINYAKMLFIEMFSILQCICFVFI